MFSRPVTVLMISILMISVTETGLAQSQGMDPWQFINRPVYVFNKTIDGLIIRPIALCYKNFLPGPAKTGIRNFFNNLDDANVIINDVFQLKLAQASMDSGRLLVNSTVGFGGMLDMAEKLGWHKHYEDFGQTLGYWGMGDGGYLMLPVLGSSTLRDAVGTIPDMFFNPVRLLKRNDVRNTLFALDMVDARVSYLAAEGMIRGDEYSFIRNAYMQRRVYLIADGEPEDEFDDF